VKGRASPSGPAALFTIEVSVVVPAIPPGGPPVTVLIDLPGAEPGDVVVPAVDFGPALTFLGLPIVTAPNVLTSRVINITGAGDPGGTFKGPVLVAKTRVLAV